MPVNQPMSGRCVSPQVDDLITSLRGPRFNVARGGAHASPKPYLYCTTRSPECLKKFMSCPSPRFFSLSQPRRHAMYYLRIRPCNS